MHSGLEAGVEQSLGPPSGRNALGKAWRIANGLPIPSEPLSNVGVMGLQGATVSLFSSFRNDACLEIGEAMSPISTGT